MTTEYPSVALSPDQAGRGLIFGRSLRSRGTAPP